MCENLADARNQPRARPDGGVAVSGKCSTSLRSVSRFSPVTKECRLSLRERSDLSRNEKRLRRVLLDGLKCLDDAAESFPFFFSGRASYDVPTTRFHLDRASGGDCDHRRLD